DFAGVLVVRNDGEASGIPVGGESYDVGDVLENGAEVVYVGTGTSFSVANPGPGFVGFTVWAFDDLHNYGHSHSAGVSIELPAQEGTISVDASDESVVVGAAVNINVSAVASYDGNVGVLTLTVTLTNPTLSVIHAPKLLVSNLDPGTASFANADGTRD